MKKLISLLLTVSLCLGLCVSAAATNFIPAEGPADGDAAPAAEAEGDAVPEEGTSGDDAPETEAPEDDAPAAQIPEDDGFETSSAPWTIFVYLCGSDLESDGGSASKDLWEMIAASPDGVRFVVETGGTTKWGNGFVSADAIERYVVGNGKYRLVDSRPQASMGSGVTLTEFLHWGIEHYPAEHYGLILWNHGSGSINGLCFDETANDDSLSLSELDAAYYSAAARMDRPFDFIGYDACLMSTVETAAITARYARYMIASQETEPSSGWDYVTIGDYLAANPDADMEALGRVICDSYMESCLAAGRGQDSTLALIDLSRIDALRASFDRYAEDLYRLSLEEGAYAPVARAVAAAENYGGNNRAEGFTNMVDLGGVISAGAEYSEHTQEALDALQDAVVYEVHGPLHSRATGLSVYYPLRVEGSMELRIFRDVSVSAYYLGLVDAIAYAYINIGISGPSGSGDGSGDEGGVNTIGGPAATPAPTYTPVGSNSIADLIGVHSDETGPAETAPTEEPPAEEVSEAEEPGVNVVEDGEAEEETAPVPEEEPVAPVVTPDIPFEPNPDADTDPGTDDGEDPGPSNVLDDFYEPSDYPEPLWTASGESAAIDFAVPPHLSEDGIFGFVLSQNGLNGTASVQAAVYLLNDADDAICLGYTSDVSADWDSGAVEDNFDGYWFGLPDGQPLCVYLVEEGDGYDLFTSPILLDGRRTNLRFVWDYRADSVYILDVWDGVDESGAVARSGYDLQPGDRITPLYDVFNLDGEAVYIRNGNPYAYDGDERLSFEPLPDGDFLYRFVINDIYGDYLLTDAVTFSIEDGEIWFWPEDDAAA